MNSTFTTASSISLKRTWSGATNSNRQTDDSSSRSGIPPLPKISGEILLQVLTHRSLRRSDGGSEDFDNERLAELGKQVLDTAITAALFNRTPVLSGLEMLEQRKSILSEENLDGWVSMYGLRKKVRCTAEVVPSLMTPEETQTLFHAYIGGLYRDSGALEQVQQWLENLISDNTPIHSTRATAETSPPTSMNTGEPQTSAGPPPYVNNAPNRPPPQKKIKSDPVAVFCAAQPGPSVSSMPFTPPTVYPSGYNQTQYNTFANPLTPAQPNLAFLPLFNQTASQRRVKVEYPSDFMGPSHAGKWTVRCCVNGIIKGVGTGGSKQVAKEEAAKQAWYNLGWS
ncbi:hypothetical protein BT96DRAFT_1013727 [Gymnopus androsaceus JB14]|uniref:Uncharacterized protein n=1 Tax=Gymnopus androsaceus JB14 TaxID=1447944 RepID=A0A6A4IGS4_9AGAR|nr:hypothetical protein BT96DRAFT_1013727 [Gymnopus androsaceus JB14]